jgi:hypothetical protein
METMDKITCKAMVMNKLEDPDKGAVNLVDKIEKALSKKQIQRQNSQPS